MGLFDKHAQPKVHLSGAYFASHPDIQVSGPVAIDMNDNGVTVSKKRAPLKTFRWDEVINYDFRTETKQQRSQRITATRMLTLGVFSLAAPKKSVSINSKTVEVVHTTTGDIEVESGIQASGGAVGSMAQLTVAMLEKQHQRAKHFVAERARGPKPTYGPNPSNSTEELVQLAELHKQGILTDEEFAAKKRQLLGL